MANFFATILSTILAGPPDGDPALPPRHLTLDDLDSVRYKGQDERTDLRLYAEKIRRLKQSRESDATYPTLNQEELRKVIKAVGLSNEERLHLIAAIAATKVQEELAPRISSRRAYLAAEKLLLLIVEGMRELEAEETFGGTFKSGGPASMHEVNGFDQRYHEALTAIDRGLLTLSAVRYLEDMHEKQALARQAYDAFSRALSEFDAHPQAGDPWSYWHHEAEQGQAAAQRYLS